MSVCRSYLQWSAICQFAAVLWTFAVISMPISFVQAQAPLCQDLFISDEVIIERLKVLAELQFKISAGEYNLKTEDREYAELSYREQVSGVVKNIGFDRFKGLYAQAQKTVQKSEIQQKQEKRNDKEIKIEVVKALDGLLKIKRDGSFNGNVIKYFESVEIKKRKYMAERIRTEWLNAEHGTAENTFSMYYLDILKDKIYEGDVQKIQELFDLEMFDVHSQNESGFSILMQASYADKKSVIDWVLQNHKFNINKKDSQGITDVEKLRLFGKSEIADYVEGIRPESRSRKFAIKERNEEKTDLYPEGTPILSFVEIKPGKFKMDDGETKVSVTLTKPFAIMSTQTTQKMWRDLAELAELHLPGKYQFLEDHSKFKSDMNPVEQLRSHGSVIDWTKAANELSVIDNPEIQKALMEIFPDHQKGDIYRLPTEAEWEYVVRLGGLANGNYAHGLTDKNLGDYAWYDGNSESKTHPVGLKKPILINGKPIYDIHGNVWELLLDWFGNNPPGGIDPLELTKRFGQGIRGGSWNNYAKYLSSGHRLYTLFGCPTGVDNLGFRVLRTRQ